MATKDSTYLFFYSNNQIQIILILCMFCLRKQGVNAKELGELVTCLNLAIFVMIILSAGLLCSPTEVTVTVSGVRKLARATYFRP